MADLRTIEVPDELRYHSLSEQELSPLTPQQQALAKDWNVIKRQTEWTMGHIVDIHNLLVEHDKALDQWRFWVKTISLLTGGGGIAVYAVLKLFHGGVP